MTLGIGALVATYVVVALVLLGFGLYSKWPWQAKVAGIVVVSASYLAVYFALPALLGWPTDRSVPKKMNLIAVYIQEPDQVTGARGEVFFWAVDMAPGADDRPRAYRLPFSPELKATFQEAHGKLRKNIPQELETQEADEGPMGVPKNMTRIGQKSVKIQVRDAPVDLPPSKDAPR